MKIVKNYLTKNPCYKAGRKIEVKGLMLHSVGCPQPKASAFLNSWNKESFRNACVHAFIDGNTGIIYQALPWNRRGWHCGSGKKGSGNSSHIGVEMCEPACIKYTGGSSFTCSDKETAKAVVKRTYDSAVELFAMLCKEYGLDPMKDGVIVSHREGHQREIASNHGDPEHLWKGLGLNYTMAGFRADVKKAMESKVEESVESDKEEAGFRPYIVRVKIGNLNIRKGPGTNYKKAGKYTGKGSFTIVDEADGKGATKWGLLKAYEKGRDGWISLDYGERVSR